MNGGGGSYNERTITGMQVFLSKKIGIPSATELQCIEWNNNSNYIAAGGTNGLLKVVKLTSEHIAVAGSGVSAASAQNNLSVNQSLEGHAGVVQRAVWNEARQKLTTSDSRGLIIVWSVHNETWVEEMLNNRQKSTVVDMSWNYDGSRIVIAYLDGHAIIGTADGNRMWNKDLPGQLAACTWSPDGSILLFGMTDGEVHSYDNTGQFILKLHMVCLENVEIETALTKDLRKDEIITLRWWAPVARHYNNPAELMQQHAVVPAMSAADDGGDVEAGLTSTSSSSTQGRPSLCIAYTHGVVQLMRHETDMNPVVVRLPSLTVASTKWSPNGCFLVIAGRQNDLPEGEQNVALFLTAYGIKLRTLKVTGSSLTDCAWDPSGLRVALTVDAAIYFASIRPNYIWGYFAHTLVYCCERIERGNYRVNFFDTKLEECHPRTVRALVSLATNDNFCVLVSGEEEAVAFGASIPTASPQTPTAGLGNGGGGGSGNGNGGQKKDDSRSFLVQLCNGIGTALDYRVVKLPSVVQCALKDTVALLASTDSFTLVVFDVPIQHVPSEGTAYGQTSNAVPLVAADFRQLLERVFHMDEFDGGASSSSGLISAASDPTAGSLLPGRHRRRSHDPITAVCMGATFFLVLRSSGNLYRFSLRDATLQAKYMVCSNVEHLALNCDDSRVATVNQYGVLRLFDLPLDGNPKAGAQVVQGIERSDVWSLKWDAESADTLAVMEKTKMHVIRGTEQEDPILGNGGFICSFRGLTVRTALLDELLRQPDSPSRTFIKDIEVKTLREAKFMLDKVKLSDATAYIEKNSHPKLWSLLSEIALQKLELDVAEHAFIKLKDYIGVQFCKRLEHIKSPDLRRAEVAAFLGDLEEAERIYLEHDRMDLALDLLERTHGWKRVLTLLQQSGAGNDQLLKEAYVHVGDAFAEKQKWSVAARHYEQGGAVEKLAHAFLMLDDFARLEKLAGQLPEGHALLAEMGSWFGHAGLCEQAVACFQRCGRINEALDVCIQLNQWETAVTISKKHGLSDVDGLVQKYMSELKGNADGMLTAVQLYMRAGRHLDAVGIVFKIIKTERQRCAAPLRLKKLYVLAARILNNLHEQARRLDGDETGAGGGGKDETGTAQGMSTANRVLGGLLAEDSRLSAEDSKLLEGAWRGAIAYHFFMFATRLLYKGDFECALSAALYLTNFEDLIEPVEIYSILALASANMNEWWVCSRAFMRLEQIDESYKSLAVAIFSKHTPVVEKEPSSSSAARWVECSGCEAHVPVWQPSCPRCDSKFALCIASARPIHHYQFWLCPMCKQRAYEQHVANFNYCPLCHFDIHATSTAGGGGVDDI